IWENIKGKNAPDVAETLNNMGELYRARRDYKTALTLHKRALKIRRGIYAPNSPQVTESMLNIGSVYYQQNDLKHAEEEFRQVWQAYQERQDVPVKLRAACLNNLAALRYRQGDKIAAAAYFEQAYNTYLKAYGPKHPNTLRTKRNLNIVRQQINP
ncbi:MAG: tetratricopeptide repeat protein, partial [Paludibacteraceae bacterium]|nr:tetratricopeptide repeat protein [Paludibacteraceae bacterium]